MKHLPTPLGNAVEREVDEDRVHELWRGTETLLRRRGVGRRPLALVLAAGVVVLVALVATRLPVQSATPVAPTAADEPAVFLTLADGSAPVMVRTGTSQRAIRFADGSTVTVSPASVLAPLVNDARELALGLDAGRVEVDVVPGGERRWRIVCGPVAVDVVGTHFAVERRAGSVFVDVTRGVVRVSGEPMPHGPTLVHAGESIEIELDDVLDADAELVVAALAPPGTSVRGFAPAAPPTPREEVAAETPASAPVIARGPPSVPELMASADEARLSDRPADAISILEQLLETHADDAEAPLAAIILARLERARGHHARAAEVLRLALELGVPRTLDEEVRAERLRELDAAGAREICAAEARAYLETYPDGAHVADARRCSFAP